ncbi:MAG: sialidase family protein [bacterium]
MKSSDNSIQKWRNTPPEIREAAFSTTDSQSRTSMTVDGPYAIDAGSGQFLHGPCVTRCANGDWIVAYQDALDDPGRESVIRQRRSTDGGIRWVDEGIVYDERKEGFGARNPAFGQTPSGKILMIVQRVGLRRLGLVRGENIMGSVALVSSDNGKTYHSKGVIDKKIRQGHQGCSTHLVYHNGELLMPAFHPKGLVLYISSDEGETWQERIVVAPREEFNETPAYPTVIPRPDGSLLFLAHLNRAVRCFRRISADGGRTWGEIQLCKDIQLRHPVLGYVGNTMICAGRNMNVWKPALCVSPDHGETWSEMIDLLPERPSGGGYTALWPTENKNKVLIVTSTSGSTPAAQDIAGLFIEDIQIY